jgi:hypothetical protein
MYAIYGYVFIKRILFILYALLVVVHIYYCGPQMRANKETDWLARPQVMPCQSNSDGTTNLTVSTSQLTSAYVHIIHHITLDYTT